MRRLLERVGLGRPELRAWALYDWANSAFVLSVVTVIFPVYFERVLAAGADEGVALQRFAWITSAALLVIAILSPFLGAIADFAGIRKRLLAVFLGIGALATASLYFVHEGDWLLGALLFALANVGAQGAFVFYDSLLGHVAKPHEVDRVSTAGYAVGYFGSALLLTAQLAWMFHPEWFGLPAGAGRSPSETTLPQRLAFVTTAVWWVAFSIPLFRTVSEPARRIETDERPGQDPARVALERLRETFRDLRSYRHAFLMLVAFLVYNDGIGTIIRMGTIYASELEIGLVAITVSLLAAQVVGIPFAFLFGNLAGKIGPKRAILIGLGVYVGVTIYAFFLDSAIEFFVLSVVVATVQGGAQALSRSLFTSLIPAHRSGEFFGFYGVLDKFAAVTGPALFGLGVALTGSVRSGILPVLLYFLVGGFLLMRVDVETGRRAARAAEDDLVPAR